MDEHSSNKNPKRRRRALTWGIFGLAGVIMSTAWATGFASSDSSVAGSVPQNSFGQGASDSQTLSPYQGKLTEVSDLAISFDGRWGQIEMDTDVFQVDLSDFTEGTYYVDIYVDNLPFDSPWSSAQIKWLQRSGPCGADPLAVDYGADDVVVATDDPGTPKVMNVTTADARVSFKDLANSQVYCFGVSSTDLSDETDLALEGEFLHADDETGTYLVRPGKEGDDGITYDVVPTAPIFTAIVNRSA